MVRPDVQDTIDTMNDEERDYVRQQEDKYYFEHWHRVLLDLLLYRNPHVASIEDYSVLTLKANKNNPIFFHVDFIRPGKSTYVVEHKQQFNESSLMVNAFDKIAEGTVGFVDKLKTQSTKKDFFATKRGSTIRGQAPAKIYVHNMLTQFRQEDINSCKSLRHSSFFLSKPLPYPLVL